MVKKNFLKAALFLQASRRTSIRYNLFHCKPRPTIAAVEAGFAYVLRDLWNKRTGGRPRKHGLEIGVEDG